VADPFPLLDLLGMRLDLVEPGRARAHLQVTADMLNPNGVAHGGIPFVAVDTAMGVAVSSQLEPGRRCASVEVHIRFLEAIGTGVLEATATVTRPGRRLVHAEAEVRTGDGLLAATATGTFAVLGD
jgi:uncharacterized protein (TIGR00369 family)